MTHDTRFVNMLDGDAKVVANNPEPTFEDYIHVTLPYQDQESVVEMKGSEPLPKVDNSRLALTTLPLCLAAIATPLFRARRVPPLH